MNVKKREYKKYVAGGLADSADAPEGPWEVKTNKWAFWYVRKAILPEGYRSVGDFDTEPEANAVRNVLNRLDAQQKGGVNAKNHQETC